ncbi:hypothetical protein llap_11399 [Limosa lapponica baueri]|uniref:Uncharacterized protein n=1 Tax=Limosa lapponica baueri TaxID=1758121 RepID=A0A2I0TWZ1_LIMLA|nr:hypothetical protein llap_11399 [Limosa lapponica baueri]
MCLWSWAKSCDKNFQWPSPLCLQREGLPRLDATSSKGDTLKKEKGLSCPSNNKSTAGARITLSRKAQKRGFVQPSITHKRNPAKVPFPCASSGNIKALKAEGNNYTAHKESKSEIRITG